MFRVIVVPLDGSPFAEQVVPTAIRLAEAGQGRLVLTRVLVPPPSPPASDAQGARLHDSRFLKELRTAARGYLDAATRRVAAHAAVPVESVVVDGDVAGAVRDLAAGLGAELVVMASRDHGELERPVRESVAERVAREGGIPVLVMRRPDASPGAEPGGDPTALPEHPFRNVLIPLDGSATAESVVEAAARLARASHAAVTLLGLRDPSLPDAGTPEVAPGLEYLAEVASPLRDGGLAVDIREMEDPHPAQAIVRAAVEVGADVIAMGTPAPGGLARLLPGSVALDVVRAGPVPVLLLQALTDAGRAPAAASAPGGAPPQPA